MSINTLLVLACFFVVYFSTYAIITNRNNERLNLTNTDNPGVMIAEKNNFSARSDFSAFFFIMLDDENTMVSAQSYNAFPKKLFVDARNVYLEKGENKGSAYLFGKNWIYTTTVSIKLSSDMTEKNKKIIFLDVTESMKLLHVFLFVFLAICLCILVINLFVSIIFSKKVIRPISISLEKQKQFISDASHELKTPLATILANVEALVAESDSKKTNPWIVHIVSQIQRMEMLITNMLTLAKYDENSGGIQSSAFNLSLMLHEVLTEMEVRMYEKNIFLHQAIQSDILIKNNASDIKQVIVILLDNAIKYTDERGEVFIKAEKKRHRVKITIQNTCSGIDQKNLSHLFDRFYRANASRNHEGSFGLGLSIAKSIIENLDGKILVKSIEHDRVVFSVILKSL